MSKLFIYTEIDNVDQSFDNIWLSTEYKDLKEFRKENPDFRALLSYKTSDVCKKTITKLEKDNARLRDFIKEMISYVGVPYWEEKANELLKEKGKKE